MADKKMLIKLGLENKKYVAGLAQTKTRTQRFVSSVQKSLGSVSMKKAALSITAFGAAVTASLGVVTKAAAEQEVIFRTLRTQVELAGLSWTDSKKRIDAFATSLQKTTKFGDTDTAKVLQQMLIHTKDLDAAMRATKIAMDLAASGLFNITTASRNVGLAMGGNIEILGRYISEFKAANNPLLKTMDATQKAAFAMDVLTEKFGGAAQEELKTFIGSLTQTKNFIGDLAESIGDILLPTMTNYSMRVRDVTINSIKWVETNKELVVGLTKTAAAVGVLAVSLGVLLTGSLALPAVITAVIRLTGALAALGAGSAALGGLGVLAVGGAIAVGIKGIFDHLAKINRMKFEGVKELAKGKDIFIPGKGLIPETQFRAENLAGILSRMKELAKEGMSFEQAWANFSKSLTTDNAARQAFGEYIIDIKRMTQALFPKDIIPAKRKPGTDFSLLPNIDATGARQEAISSLAAAGSKTAMLSATASLKKFQEIARKAAQDTKKLTAEWQYFGNQMSFVLGGALTESGNVFRNIGRNFQRMLTQMVADLLAKKAVFALLNLIPGGSFLGKGITALAGFAKGGSVSGGRPIIVGEQGPELFVPSSHGKIVPNQEINTSSDNRQYIFQIIAGDRNKTELAEEINEMVINGNIPALSE